MAIDRISPVALPWGVSRQRPRETQAAAPLEQAQAARSPAATVDGDEALLRLSGLPLTQALAPGDRLLVQVQSISSPQLQAVVVGKLESPPSPPTLAALPPAMAPPDPLLRGRLRWQPPEPAALAATWQRMVLGRMDGDRDSAPARPNLAALPAPSTVTWPLVQEGAGAALRGPARWLYPAYAWGGLQFLLRVVEPIERRAPARQHRRARVRRLLLALRLEVELPTLGTAAMQVQLAGNGGVLLLFFADHAQAETVVRQLTPALTRALAAAGLRLLHCAAVPQPPPAASWPPPAAEPSPQTLPAPLFQAAALAAVALAGCLPLSPACR